jgi:uncharacterized protein YecT (DUF1311 family)
LFCEQLAANDSAARDEETLVKIRARLDAASQPLVARLEKLADEFSQEEGAARAEDSRGGTGYPAFVVEAQTRAFERFVALLDARTTARAPAASAADYARADAGLNAAFQATLRAVDPCTACHDDPKEGRDQWRAAQRAWIAYRDAWLLVYRARWKNAAPPEALDREIGALLTRERAKELSPRR